LYRSFKAKLRRFLQNAHPKKLKNRMFSRPFIIIHH
jgi:hypothetical protein